MTLATIRAGIALWDDYRQYLAKMLEYFGQGVCFYYEKPADVYNSEYIHAYAAIEAGKFVFYLIPEEFDNEESEDIIADKTARCLVVPSPLGSHEIDEDETWDRIDLWENNYPVWSDAQIKHSKDGIYRAFAIPFDDFESDVSVVFLALEANGEAPPLAFDADLVIASPDGKNMRYDDFVRPVPPYSPTLTYESFYLLHPVS